MSTESHTCPRGKAEEGSNAVGAGRIEHNTIRGGSRGVKERPISTKTADFIEAIDRESRDHFKAQNLML